MIPLAHEGGGGLGVFRNNQPQFFDRPALVLFIDHVILKTTDHGLGGSFIISNGRKTIFVINRVPTDFPSKNYRIMGRFRKKL